MIFHAYIKRCSSLWRLWRSHHWVSGEIAGIPFRYVAGDNYESGQLTAEQVAALQRHEDVELVGHGHTTATAALTHMPEHGVLQEPAEDKVLLPAAAEVSEQIEEPAPALPLAVPIVPASPSAAPVSRPVAPVSGSWSKSRRRG